MNYKILICLLLVFVNSKKEINSPSGKIKTLLGISSGNLKEVSETEYCTSETEDQCLAETIPVAGSQCCFMSLKNFESMGACSAFPTEIESFAPLFKMNEYKAIEKEETGYEIYEGDKDAGEQTIPQANYLLKCSDGEAELSVGGYTLTEKDKSIFTNEKHCLKLKQLKTENYLYDVGKCEEGLLTDSTKKAGIDCGYQVYNIKVDSQNTITYKTCDLFNLKLMSKVITIDYGENQMFNEIDSIISERGIDKYESYTAETYNAKGQKISYDSKTGKYEVTGNLGNMISFGHLFLLILILF